MANAAVHRFEYEGWNVVVELDGSTLDGVISRHADLTGKKDGRACRIALAGKHQDAASAISSLSKKSRAYIDERHSKAASANPLSSTSRGLGTLDRRRICMTRERRTQ